MHKRFVANIVSSIVMIVSFIMFIPLCWAVKENMYSKEVKAFLCAIFVGIFVSAVVKLVFKIKKQDYEKLNTKDGLAIVGLSWILLSLLGAMPLYFSNVVPSYIDAFFEITSGFTTTGATIFTNVEILPRGILFWRSLTHWLGGMGIIVFCLAILPALGQSSFQIFKAEAPGITVERIEPRIRETAKTLWGVYFLLSLLETILLMLGGMPLFDSLCHTFGTMATGGFSTKNASIGAYNHYIQWVVTVFMFFAGMNFMLHYQVLKGKFKNIFKDEELKSFFILVVSTVFTFAVVLKCTGLDSSPLRHAAFQVVSILTTTGYVTTDFNLWPNALRMVLVLLMFIGGCGGSTGGGMKVSRFFLSVKVAIASIIQTIFPNAVLPIRFNGAVCSSRLVISVVSYVLIFIFLFLFGAFFIAAVEGCDLTTAVSASIASLGNIGPGLSKVGATQNYAWLSKYSKLVLAFLMLAGRLELYAILILFAPATWRK